MERPLSGCVPIPGAGHRERYRPHFHLGRLGPAETVCVTWPATLLHDGLVLDGLDEHDRRLVVEALCVGLCTPDPGTAIRARADAVRADPGDLHDPEEARSAFLATVTLFGI